MSKGAETVLQYNQLSKENFLSKNPINNAFIKPEYHSYDYSAYYDTVQPNNSPEYTNTLVYKLPKDPDTLGNMSLLLELPPLVKTSGTFACWTNSIGFAFFEYIEFYIGDILYFKKYSETCDYTFSFQKQAPDESQNVMIGKYTNLFQLQNNASTKSKYLVPILDLVPDKSLFLFQIQNQSVQIKLKLRKFEEIVNYDGITGPIEAKIVKLDLYNMYYKIGKTLKEKLKTKNLFQIMQHNYNIYQGASKITIPFSGDTTQLTIMCRTKDRTLNNDWFNYSLNGNPIVDTIAIKLDNIDLVVPTSEFVLRNANNYFKLNASSRYIYTIPFADNLNNLEYSGSLNLRETKHLEIVLTFNNINFQDFDIIIFSTRYNWLKTSNGKYSLLFID